MINSTRPNSTRPNALLSKLSTRSLRESRRSLKQTSLRMDALTAGMEARAARFRRPADDLDITAPMPCIKVDALREVCK